MVAGTTILLVDDDPDILAAMEVTFTRAGYRVLTAADGNQALALAERDGPAVVVVDMMMPRKSGFLVLETLKRRGAAGPRVIMITGNEGGRHRAYAESLGVDDYIRKPFDMERLVQSVRRLCPCEARTEVVRS
jgi:DNA-binding response OmpR family regulator